MNEAIWICFLLLGSLAWAQPDLKPTAVIRHAPISEQSGIAASQRYPGLFWIHNDSGDQPRLFAIDRAGNVILPGWMEQRGFYAGQPVEGKRPFEGLLIEQASNIDWEDIAVHDGLIYICDLGNNGNARRDLGIYVVREPNPRAIHRARVLEWIPVEFEDQEQFPPDSAWEFDAEGMFVFQDRLYFVTKHRPAHRISVPGLGTKLYRLDSLDPRRVNRLVQVDRHPDLGGWATAADLSPDGKTLAILCEAPQRAVWLFSTPPSGDRFFQQPARRLLVDGVQQAEGICFIDADTLLITNEQGELFEVRVQDFQVVRPGKTL